MGIGNTAMELVEIKKIYDAASDMERILRIMSNRYRIMVICKLMEEEKCVTDLNEGLNITQSALSQHLSLLRSAGLVNTRRDKQTIYYSIKDEKLKDLMMALSNIFQCATFIDEEKA